MAEHAIAGPELEKGLRLACAWLIDVAQIREEVVPPAAETRGLCHRRWQGAMRGEYSAAERTWSFFCPVWHTGQAVKALVLAHRALGDAAWLEAARLGAGFIGAERVSDPADEDHGLIFAYEDLPDVVNTSAVLECLDGLLHLADDTGESCYRQWALAALDWVGRRAYQAGSGLFRDCYRPAERRFVDPGWNDQPRHHAGRPLLDDALFLSGHRLTGNAAWRKIFLETADRLLADEDPPGNWVAFLPCQREAGRIHPRHAYWWGLPMLAGWESTGDDRYRACALRAAAWYQRALRRDGGLLRNTYIDFGTDSFGHATSGAACAAIVFHQVERVLGDGRHRADRDRALRFCLDMQFRDVEDPNLAGAILEKVLPPGHSDRSPYHLRDLGTIFFVQAAARVLLDDA